MPKKTKTEADIERVAVGLVETFYGGEALKLRIDGRSGFPDRTIILPDRPIFTVEFKKPSGVVSDSQRYWHRRLISLGKSNFIVDNNDDFVAILDRAVDIAKKPIEQYEFYDRTVKKYL